MASCTTGSDHNPVGTRHDRRTSAFFGSHRTTSVLLHGQVSRHLLKCREEQGTIVNKKVSTVQWTM